MKWINAEQRVTVSIYDEEHEEYLDKIMTVEEMLDAYTNEGCPTIYSNPEQTRWIPLKTRPMTEEEKEEIGFDFDYMYDCLLPDYGQEVLITDCCGNVEIDTFYRDYDGVYFEGNCDDGEVVAWMPLPQSYKAESEVEK